LVLGIFTMTAAMAPSFAWAFGSFLLAGLGYSFLNPASTKGVMGWFQRNERATAMGAKQTGVPTGGVATALIGAPLVLMWGWRGALAAIGAGNLLFGLLFWALWRNPPGEVDAPEPQLPSAKGEPLKVRSLLSVSCGTALFLVGQMSLLTYVPLYLKETLGFSAYWASQALAVAQAGAMLGRIGWGAVSDRLFRGQRKIVLVLVGALSILLTLGLSLFHSGTSPFLLIPFIFLAGFCMIGYQGVSYSLIGELAGKARTGTALGLMITVNATAATLGTPLFGYLVDMTGSYPLAWRALSGVILSGTLGLMMLVKEPKP
jgi:predicted MFS family arabinose efflux permease